MRTYAALAVLMLAAPVAAKPLPSTMKVAVKKGRVMLTTEGVSVALVEGFSQVDEATAELADDGSAINVKASTCNMGLDFVDEPTAIPMAIVNAKIANAKGMALHVKKKYADAAKLFEQATKGDAATPVYATNWLSALAMGGEIEKANKLLEDGLAKSHIAWFAWRLAVDSELKKLKDQPAAKKLRADKPGKLTSKKLKRDAIAISPLGLAAIITVDAIGQSSDSYVSFVQLDTGTETLRFSAPSKDADVTLATLGFAVVKGTLQRTDDDEGRKLSDKMQSQADVRAVAQVNGYYVFMEREGGCDVSEVRFHGGAEKAK